MDSDQPVNEKQEADRIVVGRINGAYGIKGWVKIFSYTDPIEKILRYTPWHMVRESRRGSRPQERGKKQAEDSILEFESGKVHGKGVIALPKGFKDRDQAESLRGFEIWVDRGCCHHSKPEIITGTSWKIYRCEMSKTNVLDMSVIC